MNKSAVATLVSTMVIVLDYVTKRIIVAKLAPYDSIQVFPFLNIVYVENKGGCFWDVRKSGE